MKLNKNCMLLNSVILIVLTNCNIFQIYAYDCDALKLCRDNLCCSQFNWCGSGDAWCGTGCLSGK